jgi:hypothetical protein
MDSREVAEFVRLPYSSFREIAPRCPGTPSHRSGSVYVRKESLEWLLKR